MEILFSFAKYYGIPGLCLAGVIVVWFKMKDKVEKTDCSKNRKEFYEESKTNAVMFAEIQKDFEHIKGQLEKLNGVKR
jgi:hypothetical protein